MPVSRMKPGPIPKKPPRRGSEMRKERQPSKTPHVKSWPPRKQFKDESKEDYDLYLAVLWLPPAPDRPTRDSSRKPIHWSERQPSNTPFSRNWPRSPSGIETLILRFIDWLNALLGVGKPKGKRKEHTEEMATLADLFEEVDRERGTNYK